MFDFNKYPTLIKFHKKYDKYSSRSTKRLIDNMRKIFTCLVEEDGGIYSAVEAKQLGA